MGLLKKLTKTTINIIEKTTNDFNVLLKILTAVSRLSKIAILSVDTELIQKSNIMGYRLKTKNLIIFVEVVKKTIVFILKATKIFNKKPIFFLEKHKTKKLTIIDKLIGYSRDIGFIKNKLNIYSKNKILQSKSLVLRSKKYLMSTIKFVMFKKILTYRLANNINIKFKKTWINSLYG